MSDIPLTYNIEAVRAAMLSGLIVPREIVHKAFARLDEQLDAKETKFFTFRGKVMSQVDVRDNGTVMQAIDQTMSLAGLYKPDDRRSAGPSIPSFAVEVTRDGVIRIAVGSSLGNQLADREPAQDISMVIPTAIPLSVEKSGHAVDLVPDKVSHPSVDRFNTILDEIVDE